MKNIRWPDTKITKLLNIHLPIIQAPMAGGATTPELVAAVSNADGLGSLGAGYLTPDEIKSAIKKIRTLTHRPFSVNLFIPEKHHATDEQIEYARKTIQAACAELNFIIVPITPPYLPDFDEQMDVIVREKVPVFSFTFGIPSASWLEILKKNNITLIGTATSLEEAKYLEKNNIDAIVAQGSEAGGHRGTFFSAKENALVEISLLTQVLVENIKIPIIAAGGIMDAKTIIKALSWDASAVQMGTAFLCCPESGISPSYKKSLLNSAYDNTTLTRAFSGKVARGIINKFISRIERHQQSILDYPIQNALTRSMRKEAARQNNIEFMSMWAGQRAFLCKELPAAKLIENLENEIITLINNQS